MAPEYSYGVYGVALASEFALALPAAAGPALAEVSLRRAPSSDLRAIVADTPLVNRDEWYDYAHLADGSSYVRWKGLGEFLVGPGGAEIRCAKAEEASEESFQVYLLGQALSFALVKRGFEPLHATAVVHEGEAIVLLGSGGYGKSTLAASFLAAGATLLTDDLLIVHQDAGRILAFPGPSRIKLFPDSAHRFLGPAATGGSPMNNFSNKHVIPLDAAQRCIHPVPIRGVYALAPPEEMRRQRQVRITPLSQREAFLALIANTFNRYIGDPARLSRQHAETGRLSRAIAIRKLAYPRSTARLAEVREAILEDSKADETAAA
jgi:hypothetical protein